MNIYHSVGEARVACRSVRAKGKRLGLVPTMGALHEGHLSLVRAAKAQCDVVAVSLFVNPTQFGPTEDLARYPRPFERDRQLLDKAGVEILFAPSAEEMYPKGDGTWVTVEGLKLEVSDAAGGRKRVSAKSLTMTVTTEWDRQVTTYDGKCSTTTWEVTDPEEYGGEEFQPDAWTQWIAKSSP